MIDCKHPEVLVSTDWVARHTDDPKVRRVEVDVDTGAYQKGHIKNAVGWNWTTQLNDTVRRDIPDTRQFKELCNSAGMSNDTTVVLYGDNNNGTFKSYDELLRLYESQGVRPDREAMAYSRIGERSSHSWFVLKYLLGFPKVRN